MFLHVEFLLGQTSAWRWFQINFAYITTTERKGNYTIAFDQFL